MHINSKDVNGGTSYHSVSDTMLVLIGTTLHCNVLLFQGNSTNQLVILMRSIALSLERALADLGVRQRRPAQGTRTCYVPTTTT